jgi:hypothetical protein
MTIQEAINKANEGGYHIQSSDGMATYYSGANSEFSVWTRQDNASSFLVPVEETFLDPAFWQALGRALDTDGIAPDGNWKHLWHQFIEHLSHGGTPPAFFQPLASASHTPTRGGHKANHGRNQTKTTAKGTGHPRTRKARPHAPSDVAPVTQASQQVRAVDTAIPRTRHGTH